MSPYKRRSEYSVTSQFSETGNCEGPSSRLISSMLKDICECEDCNEEEEKPIDLSVEIC